MGSRGLWGSATFWWGRALSGVSGVSGGEVEDHIVPPKPVHSNYYDEFCYSLKRPTYNSWRQTEDIDSFGSVLSPGGVFGERHILSEQDPCPSSDPEVEHIKGLHNPSQQFLGVPKFDIQESKLVAQLSYYVSHGSRHSSRHPRRYRWGRM